jgi:subtilisin family serine protease
VLDFPSCNDATVFGSVCAGLGIAWIRFGRKHLHELTKMIDMCAHLRGFAPGIAANNEALPLLRWIEDWRLAEGQGITAGLLDTGFDRELPDLRGANVVTRSFVGRVDPSVELTEHGTHSVAALVGQGQRQIRGIVPRVRLLVANVVEACGIATPRAVVDAVDWIVSGGAQIVVVPLGDPIERIEMVQQLDYATKSGVAVLAAAGNGYPDAVLFPARHPLAIAVGAADHRGRLLPECNRFPRLDLVAPGWRILAPIRGRRLRRRSGSSVACVIAGGVAILACSAGGIPTSSTKRLAILAALRRDGSARAPPAEVHE